MYSSRKLIFATLTLLTACAVPPKPIMPIAEQSKAGTFKAGLTQCVANGMMDSYLASRGIGFIEAGLERHQYNPANVQLAYETQIRTGSAPAKTDCASMAMTIQGWIREVDIHNAAASRDRQEIQNAINNMPKTTYCNSIGSQTMCSTR